MKNEHITKLEISITKSSDSVKAVAVALHNLCCEIGVENEEWTMSKLKLSYIVLPYHLLSDLSNHPTYPINNFNLSLDWDATPPDYVLFSLVYNRYSFNWDRVLNTAPINLHICKTENEFKSFIEAHSLGADLSNLWSKP